MKLVKHSYFERMIIVIIISSSIKLVVDTYFLDDPIESLETSILTALDIVFTVIFAIECIIKMIAFGFIID